jgi:four helix bundle protein
MKTINYKELGFFKKAHELTIEIYKITKDFPKEERYGLSSQIQRASSSVGSNIAEGSVRSSEKDFKKFLHQALGSAKEVEYQLLIAKDLDYIQTRTYDRLMYLLDIIIGSMINYMKKIIT